MSTRERNVVTENLPAAELQRAPERIARLQRVTAAFVPTLSVPEVARVMIGQGMGALGGMGGVLVRLTPDGNALELVESIGVTPGFAEATRHLLLSTPRPLTDAVRSGEPQWYENLGVLHERYPGFARQVARMGYGAWAALPLRLDGRTLGAIGLGFHGPQVFTPGDRSFAQTVTLQCAQALERAQLYEAELRERAELDATLNAINSGLLILAPSQGLVRVNSAAMRIVGVTAEAWEALSPEERARIVHAETRDGRPMPADETPGFRALRGETVLDYHLIVRRLDGDRRHVLANAGPIRGDRGQITGAVVSWADITPLVELQEQREDILRAVSHDLRNPLSAVLGQAQLLDRRLERAGWPEHAGAEAIVTNARRMNTMIQDLVDAARMESGQLTLNRQPIDLPSFARELVGRLGAALDVARVQVAEPGPLPPVSADPDRLERILTNLISNALKYSEPATPVTIAFRQADREVITSVTDRGHGIAPDEMSRLFQRYFRTGSAREQREGLGLGLYITRKLVEAHGGRIWVESKPEEGSTFSFSLPAGD